MSVELGYKQGPVSQISGYLRTDVDACDFGDPTFDGFHVSGTRALTGEQRGYDRRLGLFGNLTRLASVRAGGIGASELVARFSGLDLSDGLIEGGRGESGIPWRQLVAFPGVQGRDSIRPD